MTIPIFDLDGTIADPAEGITRSINHALIGLGYPPRPTGDLLKYIGPPLAMTFSELTGRTDEATLSRGIELYRERYIAIGYKENMIYDGMQEVLQALSNVECGLFLATTKRRDIALQVLEYFGIAHLFREVYGCDLQRTKEDLLHDIMRDKERAESSAVMIGDRDIDFNAAAACGLPSIAVTWGYGTEQEWNLASAIVETPGALLAEIRRITQPQDDVH